MILGQNTKSLLNPAFLIKGCVIAAAILVPGNKGVQFQQPPVAMGALFQHLLST